MVVAVIFVFKSVLGTPSLKPLILGYTNVLSFNSVIALFLRGFVKLKKFRKSEKNSEMGGWVKPQLIILFLILCYFVFFFVFFCCTCFKKKIG